MVMKAVEPKRPQNSYQPLTSLFKSNFITRYKATIDVYGGQQNFKNMSNTIKTADSMLKANSAEIHVLSDFLFNSELITNDDKQSGFASQMIQSSLLTWITVESLYTNIKHLSFRSNRCYFLDDSFIPVNEDQILSYYRGYSLLFPEEVTRHAIVFYKQVRDLAAKMYAHKVDEMEMAVFSLILILKHAISLNNNNVEKYQRKLNELFKQLQHHYKHNYDDLPIRLGNLILFLDELRDVSKTRDEMIILMRLHDLQDLGTHNLLWENSKPPTQQFICR
ncbi:hypothetical protein M3Y94_00004700 [Aphelenchoides besseyi]|nr:hypothetical protein M3Y94_00004700 [Aphelenchoides besseyi]